MKSLLPDIWCHPTDKSENMDKKFSCSKKQKKRQKIKLGFRMIWVSSIGNAASQTFPTAYMGVYLGEISIGIRLCVRSCVCNRPQCVPIGLMCISKRPDCEFTRVVCQQWWPELCAYTSVATTAPSPIHSSGPVGRSRGLIITWYIGPNYEARIEVR